jgi:putative Ca2+/H+ antiporter (TMEM165/GDT1 family)
MAAGKTEGRHRAPGRAARRPLSRPPFARPGVKQMDMGSFDAALVSAGTVALAEMGDKTQLLALLLAARFRRPLPIILGILASTLLNHALAGWVGTLVAHWLTPQVLRWVVATSFIAIALWSLKPDKLDEDTPVSSHGALVATMIAFFLAEMGDKTQVATVLLAARYSPLWQVVAGTTVGMLLANVPVVLLGSRFAQRLPLRAARIAAALLFLALGLWALKGAL